MVAAKSSSALIALRVRIVSGKKGRQRLRAVPGQGTRPTSAKVREAIFNILWARGFACRRVLDLYAGTGALGLEALSRGAESAVFVDKDRRVIKVIEENVVTLGYVANAQLICQTVTGWLKNPPAAPYDCVFMDPPYASDDVEKCMELLAAGWVAQGGVIVLDHSSKRAVPETWFGFARIQQRQYGGTTVSLFVPAPE